VDNADSNTLWRCAALMILLLWWPMLRLDDNVEADINKHEASHVIIFGRTILEKFLVLNAD